jgi:hypothetical protein
MMTRSSFEKDILPFASYSAVLSIMYSIDYLVTCIPMEAGMKALRQASFLRHSLLLWAVLSISLDFFNEDFVALIL